MAESFARKGWDFAQKQDRLTSTPLRKFTSPQQRSYSTLRPVTVCGKDFFPLGVREFSVPSGTDEVSMALITGNVANFPPRLKEIRKKLMDFMEEEVYPAERTLEDHQMSPDRWKPHPLIEELKVLLVLL